jgi:hypothetical protein
VAKKKQTAPTITGSVYLVQEHVKEILSDEWAEMFEEMGDEGPSMEDINLPEGWSPLKAFRDKVAAETHCLELENQRRTKENPFARGKSLEEWSHFDAPRFHDWLLDAGLEPPKKKKLAADDWREWWTKNAKKMSALQRAKVWEAVDKVRFYEVVELTE